MRIKYKPQLELNKYELSAINELLKIANDVIKEFENSDYVVEQDYKDWITTRNFLKETLKENTLEGYN